MTSHVRAMGRARARPGSGRSGAAAGRVEAAGLDDLVGREGVVFGLRGEAVEPGVVFERLLLQGRLAVEPALVEGDQDGEAPAGRGAGLLARVAQLEAQAIGVLLGGRDEADARGREGR